MVRRLLINLMMASCQEGQPGCCTQEPRSKRKSWHQAEFNTKLNVKFYTFVQIANKLRMAKA